MKFMRRGVLTLTRWPNQAMQRTRYKIRWCGSCNRSRAADLGSLGK